MRKLVAGFAISVDGYIEGINGEYDWITIDPEINFSKLMGRFDTYFLGRKTYEKSLQMGSGAFGNDKCYVFSTSLEKVGAPYELIKDDVKKHVQNLKQQQGKDIALFGGADLLTSFLQMGLIDELSLSVIPVLLGKGKPFVGLLKNPFKLSLLDTQRYSNGTVMLTYYVQNK